MHKPKVRVSLGTGPRLRSEPNYFYILSGGLSMCIFTEFAERFAEISRQLEITCDRGGQKDLLLVRDLDRKDKKPSAATNDTRGCRQSP